MSGLDSLERALVAAVGVVGDGWRDLSAEERLEGVARGRFGDFGLTVDERLNALELAHRRYLFSERFASVLLAAFASGWDETLCGEVFGRVARVFDDAERRMAECPRPSLFDAVEEFGRMAADLGKVLEALPPLVKAVNGRRVSAAIRVTEEERLAGLVDRFEKTFCAVAGGDLPGRVAGRVVQMIKGEGRKPAGALEYSEAEAVMAGICGSDAVEERSLRRWLSRGKAGRSGLAISWEDLKSVAAWSAWCEAYRCRMTDRLNRRVRFCDGRDGVSGVPAKPVTGRFGRDGCGS